VPMWRQGVAFTLRAIAIPPLGSTDTAWKGADLARYHPWAWERAWRDVRGRAVECRSPCDRHSLQNPLCLPLWRHIVAP